MTKAETLITLGIWEQRLRGRATYLRIMRDAIQSSSAPYNVEYEHLRGIAVAELSQDVDEFDISSQALAELRNLIKSTLFPRPAVHQN